MPETTPYAERASAAFADMDAQLQTDLAALDAPEAPESAPPPTPAASTETKGHGADAATGPKPATDATKPAADATPPAGEEEEKPLTPAEVRARIAEATRRAGIEQSKAVRERDALKVELDRLRQEADRARFDAQTLYQAQTEAKALAREQGGVRYEDIDSLTDKALRDQTALRHQEGLARDQRAAQQSQQAAMAGQEIARRTADGTLAYKDAVTEVLSAAAEAGIKLTRGRAEELVNATHADPLVTADKALWRDARTPYDIAKQRIEVVGKRMAELAVQGLTREAVAAVEAERKPIPTFDRTQVHGDSAGGATGQQHLTYQQRLAAALGDADSAISADMRKHAPAITTFNT